MSCPSEPDNSPELVEKIFWTYKIKDLKRRIMDICHIHTDAKGRFAMGRLCFVCHGGWNPGGVLTTETVWLTFY